MLLFIAMRKCDFSKIYVAGSEFVTGWTGKRGRKLKSKLEKTKQKVGQHKFYIYNLVDFVLCCNILMEV